MSRETQNNKMYTRVIQAKFIGTTSCGFVSGKTYDLKETNMKTSGERPIHILDTKSPAECFYSSLGSFLENWQVIKVFHEEKPATRLRRCYVTAKLAPIMLFPAQKYLGICAGVRVGNAGYDDELIITDEYEDWFRVTKPNTDLDGWVCKKFVTTRQKLGSTQSVTPASVEVEVTPPKTVEPERADKQVVNNSNLQLLVDRLREGADNAEYEGAWEHAEAYSHAAHTIIKLCKQMGIKLENTEGYE